MERRKFWLCFLCKNRKNELHQNKCITCSSSRQQDRFVVRRENGVYFCKAITGIPIPILSLYCIFADKSEKHIRTELPLNYDNIFECVMEGIDSVQNGGANHDLSPDEALNQNGSIAEESKENTVSMSVFSESNKFDDTLALESIEKSEQHGISLFDKMMRDAALQSYDPSIGRYIPTNTVAMSPNKSIIKTDLNYISKMAQQKKEMTRVVHATIQLREREADRNKKGGDKSKSNGNNAFNSMLAQGSAVESYAREQRLPCALCEHVFPSSALMGRITFKTVSEWRAARAAPIPAEDKRFHGPYLHNAVKLCLFCTAFFDEDFSDCIDKSSIHEAIGLEVDKMEGVVEPSNKASKRFMRNLIENQKDPQRPLSAMKHKVSVHQIKTRAELNNDPNAKFLYDPKETTGSKFVLAAADTRALRDTYTDTVIVRQLRQRGLVEEKNAKLREVKRKQWLDRLSGKLPTSPPKKSDQDKNKTPEKAKDKENEPNINSARSDSVAERKRGKSQSPVSRSKTAGNPLETVTERRGRRLGKRRDLSASQRGSSLASHRSEASAGDHSQHSTATKNSTRSLGRRGRSSTHRSVKSSGYTAAPWGATPVKLKRRGNSLPPERSHNRSVSESKRRTYSKASVPRLSGRARAEARKEPKPIARKPLLVMVRDKKAEKGVRTVEMKSERQTAAAADIPQQHKEKQSATGSASAGTDARKAKSSEHKDKVIPIEPLVHNKRVTRQQEQLIRGAALAYNPMGKYSPPEKKRKQMSVITRSTHAASAVPTPEEAAAKKLLIEEQARKMVEEKLRKRSLSPSVRDSASLTLTNKAEISKDTGIKTRPKLQIQGKSKGNERLEDQVDKTSKEQMEGSQTGEKPGNFSGLAAKKNTLSLPLHTKKSPQKSKNRSPGASPKVGDTEPDTTWGREDYDEDFDLEDVAQLAQNALDEVSQNVGEEHEKPMDLLPGQDTIDHYMFATANKQKLENPDKWSPEPSYAQNGNNQYIDSDVTNLQKQLFVLDATISQNSDEFSPTGSLRRSEPAKKSAKVKHASPAKVGFADPPSPTLQIQSASLKGLISAKSESRYKDDSPDSSFSLNEVTYKNETKTSELIDTRNQEMRKLTVADQQNLIDALEWEQIKSSSFTTQNTLEMQQNLADAYSFMGDLCSDQGDSSSALGAYENAYRLKQDKLMQDPNEARKGLQSLAALAIRTDNTDKATSLCEELVNVCLDGFGEGSIEFANSEVFAGRVLLQQGQKTDAAALLSDAVSVLERRLGADHTDSVQAKQLLHAATEAPITIIKHIQGNTSPKAISLKRTQSEKKNNSPKKNTTISPSKKEIASAAVEQQVQRRVAEELALIMAAEKKKLQREMEEAMAKQVAEQMAQLHKKFEEQSQLNSAKPIDESLSTKGPEQIAGLASSRNPVPEDAEKLDDAVHLSSTSAESQEDYAIDMSAYQAYQYQLPVAASNSPSIVTKHVRIGNDSPEAGVLQGSPSGSAWTAVNSSNSSTKKTRLRSPPPRPATYTDEDEPTSDGNAADMEIAQDIEANEVADADLMSLAFGTAADDDDYDDEDFASSPPSTKQQEKRITFAEAELHEEVEQLNDENVHPNTPPKPRPSSVSRKLQTHVQNARGMELLNEGQETPSGRSFDSLVSAAKTSEEIVLMELQQTANMMQGLGPSDSPDALENMKLLSIGDKPLAPKLKERKIESLEPHSGMVMLSRGSSFVKNKVASIDAAELFADDIDDADAKSVKRRLKKKISI